MNLQMDARRQAMLREMGMHLLPPLRAQVEPAEADPVAPAAPTAAARPAADSVQAPPTRPQLAPFASREGPLGVGTLDWSGLAEAVAGCRACGLCETRRNTVLGAGPARADWMVIGEAPDESEDLQGEPFVGQPGKLLDNMLRAIGLDRRRNVYIANVLKCRPPGNRNPEPHEVAQCEPFLRRQVALVQPRVILAMGRFAVQTLLQSQEPVGRLRGRVHHYEDVPVVVTYHPAYLLRNLQDKSKAWADLCLAADLMDEGRT